MTDADWSNDAARAFAVLLNGNAISEPDSRGEPIVDDSFLVIFNAWWEPLPVEYPGRTGRLLGP